MISRFSAFFVSIFGFFSKLSTPTWAPPPPWTIPQKYPQRRPKILIFRKKKYLLFKSGSTERHLYLSAPNLDSRAAVDFFLIFFGRPQSFSLKKVARFGGRLGVIFACFSGFHENGTWTRPVDGERCVRDFLNPYSIDAQSDVVLKSLRNLIHFCPIRTGDRLSQKWHFGTFGPPKPTGTATAAI